MAYIPKKRGKIQLKIALPVLAVLLLVAFLGVRFIKQKEEEKTMFSVCGFSKNQMQKHITEKYEDTYAFQDYLYYGESLYLMKDPYNVEKNDAVSGKSVLLKDVCSDKEYAFVIGSGVDRGIVLNTIEEGFYEIYVVEDLIEKRAVYASEVDSEFTTIHRAGTNREVRLRADRELFKDAEVALAENYLYLQVEKSKSDAYDVVIDPSTMDYDYTYTLNKGAEGNGLKEYEVTYEAATMLKEKLEAKGLKVLLTKDSPTMEINSYGKDGRIKKAYDSGAKYYIRLSFTASEYGYEGMDITYSSHASDQFAAQLLYHLSRESGVQFSNDGGVNNGLYMAYPWEGMDGRSVYDSDLWIRETGGKATLAGMYSKNAEEGTASFAKGNVYGMNTLSINLGYLSSSVDSTYWKQHKEEYINALVEGMSTYFVLEEE